MTTVPIRLLALGDSYTIGTSVNPIDSWPRQLSGRLSSMGIPVNAPEIIAQNGWTTADLTAGIAAANPQGSYDLVTLLIGVNNQYRGDDAEAYRPEFHALLGAAIRFAVGNPSRVIVLSIPDWGVTPFARDRQVDRNPDEIATQIDVYNAVNQAESEAAGVSYVDVTLISRLFGDDPEFLAIDGLHPSPKMYAAWVELLMPLALRILE